MKKILIPMLMITIFASLASANALSNDGNEPNMTREPTWLADRIGLVNDGSFEDGPCGGGSAWTCFSTGTSDIIVDLAQMGLWNYDGNAVAYLGGSSESVPDVSENICQEIFFDGDVLSWYWMTYINTGGNRIRATVDGNVVYEYFTDPADHLIDYQLNSVSVASYVGGLHTLCFEYELLTGFDNYFLDYVLLDASVATEEMSFSTVKALY